MVQVNSMKKRKRKILLILLSFVLGAIAIFTAARIYTLQTSPIALNVPLSEPDAAEGCELTFTLKY